MESKRQTFEQVGSEKFPSRKIACLKTFIFYFTHQRNNIEEFDAILSSELQPFFLKWQCHRPSGKVASYTVVGRGPFGPCQSFLKWHVLLFRKMLIGEELPVGQPQPVAFTVLAQNGPKAKEREMSAAMLTRLVFERPLIFHLFLKRSLK